MGVVALYAVTFALATVLTGAALAGLALLTRRFTDLTLPDTRDFLLQSLGIAAAMTAVSLVPFAGGLVSLFVGGWLIQRWFDADLAAAAILAVLTRGAEWAIVLVLAGWLGALP